MDTTIDASTTLADLVTAHPDLAAELERRSLDYCCGGQRTLAAACRDQGLDPDITAAELAAASSETPPAEWTRLDAAALVDYLETTHHAYLHTELPRIDALAAKVSGVHSATHPELTVVTTTFEQLRAELEPHLVEEEHRLFPMIRELADTDLTNETHTLLTEPIEQMLHEHDRAGELLERLRHITNGYAVPPDGCASYEALYRALEGLETDTHMHVHIENNRLFPMVTGPRSRTGSTADERGR